MKCINIERMFPTNMQTGFSNLIEPEKPDLEYLNSLLLLFAEKSITFAAHYAKHAGRENLSGMDTIYALQYLAHEFMDLPEVNSGTIKNDDCEEDDCEEDDCEEDDCEEDDCEDDDDVFTRAGDDDALCSKMNMYHDTWESWNPSDEIQILLKRNVDKTINEHVS
jgi:hypothetical protein